METEPCVTFDKGKAIENNNDIQGINKSKQEEEASLTQANIGGAGPDQPILNTGLG